MNVECLVFSILPQRHISSQSKFRGAYIKKGYECKSYFTTQCIQDLCATGNLMFSGRLFESKVMKISANS